MVSTEDILTVTNNVFQTMLGVEATLDGDSDRSESDPITGCVQITGEWKGAVMVQTSRDFSSDAACKMLSMKSDDVELIDRQEALAELTNMIGGNIKGLMPGPSSLSLPSVTSTRAHDIRVMDTAIENSVALDCNGQQIRIVVCAG
jgi:chemotaxis protein CheX